MGNTEAQFQREVESLAGGLLRTRSGAATEWSNADTCKDMKSLQEALRRAGVESCNLMVGFDFTSSNKTAGTESFHGLCLHSLDGKHGPNPYELALGIIGRALVPLFDDDGRIPAFVFGDIETKAHRVRQIGDAAGCLGMDGPEGVLAKYREAVGNALFSGPTSFAPLIDKAVEVTKASGNSLQVLLILADGQVTQGDCMRETIAAIVRASSHPLSIVMVGLGDGPWEDMATFDDYIEKSRFDNFQFVPFGKFHQLLSKASGSEQSGVVEAAFTVCALQELPLQYAAMSRLGLLGHGRGAVALERERSRSPRRGGALVVDVF